MFLRISIQKLQVILALFAVLLVTLVPALSMAFPMHQGKGVIQEICSSSADTRLVLMVTTTKGKPLATVFNLQPAKVPVSLPKHLNHCPYCDVVVDNLILPDANPAYSLYQTWVVHQQLQFYTAPVIQTEFSASIASRAPPAIL